VIPVQQVSRRRFLALGAGWTAFALAACKKKPQSPTTTAPGGTTGSSTAGAFRLDPNYSSDPAACPDGTCSACAACQAHAANRILPSATVVVRAHPGCRCLVVPDPSVSAGAYAALFANPANNPTGGPVDRRWQWVAQVLSG
jgi:hypothetical protein